MSQFESYSLIISGIQAVAVILGFVVAWSQLRQLTRDSHTTLELASRERAMNLIGRYSDPAFIERRYKIRTDEETQKDKLQCAYILNFFEELGMVVKHRIANEELLEDFFGTILDEWLSLKYMQDTIEHFQKQRETFFENLSWLQNRWKEKKREPSIAPSPELPHSH